MTKTISPIGILFICLGNICRSPLAEGVFRHVVTEAGRQAAFDIDSAATGSWHVGKPPDRRAIKVARHHGVDISNQTCRQINGHDFETFDHIVCMDYANIDDVTALQPAGSKAQIGLFMQLALGKALIIPDPYVGGRKGFETAYQMVDEASQALLKKLNS